MIVITYNPREYWNKRIKSQPNLRGTGHIAFNETYNSYLYRLKILALEKALNNYSIDIKGKSVLDVGSGTGFFINYYDMNGAKEICGIDIAEASISLLNKKYPKHSFQTIDIGTHDINIKKQFDIINVFDILYHIVDNRLFENAIYNISNLLCSDAYVLITDVFGENDLVPADHVRFRNLHKYEILLKKNKIDIIDVLPLYNSMNRNIFHLPPLALNILTPILYFVDSSLLKANVSSITNIKLLIGKKIK